jgi:hypothetical protein
MSARVLCTPFVEPCNCREGRTMARIADTLSSRRTWKRPKVA